MILREKCTSAKKQKVERRTTAVSYHLADASPAPNAADEAPAALEGSSATGNTMLMKYFGFLFSLMQIVAQFHSASNQCATKIVTYLMDQAVSRTRR